MASANQIAAVSAAIALVGGSIYALTLPGDGTPESAASFARVDVVRGDNGSCPVELVRVSQDGAQQAVPGAAYCEAFDDLPAQGAVRIVEHVSDGGRCRVEATLESGERVAWMDPACALIVSREPGHESAVDWSNLEALP